MSKARVFPDSCILIEGLCAPWSASRGVLILGRSSLFTFVIADIVIEETERALVRKAAAAFGGRRRLSEEFRYLIKRLRAERVPHARDDAFLTAQKLIRHINDVPVLAAAIQAQPDWVLTENTAHFDERVSERTGLRIATAEDFLISCGKLFR